MSYVITIYMLDWLPSSYSSTGFELEKTARRPSPKALANVPHSTWITHAIHISRTRHTKYYKGKTSSFLLRIQFRTLTWRWQWLRFLRPNLTTSNVTFSSTSMTVHWHVPVDKTCKMVLLKWSTYRNSVRDSFWTWSAVGCCFWERQMYTTHCTWSLPT